MEIQAQFSTLDFYDEPSGGQEVTHNRLLARSLARRLPLSLDTRDSEFNYFAVL